MFYVLSFLILIIDPSISDNDLSKPKPSPTPFHDWDYLVFSQRWPITACSDWKQRSPKNTCNLPDDGEKWVIHGLWPTKIGTKGPWFCPSAIHFDPDQLKPMMNELQEFWPNIENNTKPNSLWKHEWGKHGTCASTLPVLNSVTNYFNKGLEWNQDYNIGNILAKNKIVPDVQGYNASDIFDAIVTATNKIPVVNCIVEGKTKQSMISQIEICFDKNLDVIDCNITALNDGAIFGNCNEKRDIMYFSSVPNNSVTAFYDEEEMQDEIPVERCLENEFYEKDLLKLYSIIKFVMWFTL